MGTPSVAVIGSANADLVLDIPHRPAGGETILGSDLVVTSGGKGANQAVAAGRLGGAVAFVGCVGDDAYGEMLRAALAGSGVDIAGLRTVSAPTGNALILVTPDGENSIIVSPAANRHVTPALVDATEQVWLGAAVVVLQLEIPLETVSHVARRAGGSRVVVNAAPAAELDGEVLAVADPLVVNESEAAFLLERAGTAPEVSTASPDEALTVARSLLALGPRSVVVTLGPRGAALAEHGGRATHVAARPVTAVDTTGAGDAFVGALALALAHGALLEDAVRRATVVAAHTVTRRGAQESYPTRQELR
ncbi:ribokinase [Georgenia sp. M64]|uniref:ribokinase n=1 Tax=Georgenia sp. M64 TaxID=3120520 RepID=UPI0030E01A38